MSDLSQSEPLGRRLPFVLTKWAKDHPEPGRKNLHFKKTSILVRIVPQVRVEWYLGRPLSSERWDEMDRPDGLTDAQVLRTLSDSFGIDRIYLRAYESLEAVNYGDDSFSVTVKFYRVRETTYRLHVTGRGYKMLTWRMNGEGFFVYDVASFISMDDPSFDEPLTIVKGGRVETPEEASDRMRWEAQCARPGTESYPLHSADRVLRLGADTPAIDRHWRLHNEALKGA
jgi:hypothetical protein